MLVITYGRCLKTGEAANGKPFRDMIVLSCLRSNVSKLGEQISIPWIRSLGMKTFYAIYLKANVHIFLIYSIFCVPYTTVSDVDNAFFERRLDRIKFTFL